MNKRFFAILLGLIFSTSVLAQSNLSANSIKGQVVDPNQAPVAGARVTAQKKTGASAIQTVTNSNGEYEFKSLPNGEYKIIVDSSGFSSISREVTIGNDAQTLNIELSVGTLSESVTVT